MNPPRRSLGHWKADDSVSCCDACHQSFSVIRRRHHCRCCGNIFCSSCCSQYAVIPDLGTLDRQRVCSPCSMMLQSRVVPSRRSGPPSCVAISSHDAGSPDSQLPSTPTSNIDQEYGAETDHDHDSEDSEFSSDEDSLDAPVSSAVADVLSSWDERKTNHVSFLPALQGNLVASDAANVASVLLFPSERCYCVNLVTVNESERISELVTRMSEQFFRLANGPFAPFTENERATLLKELRVTTEMHYVDEDALVTSVISMSKHLVLSTLPLEELHKCSGLLPGGTVSSLRDFFDSEGLRTGVADI